MFFRTNKLCEIREQKACGDPCQYLLGHRRINTNAEPIPPLRGTEGLEICVKESSPLVWVLRSLPYSACRISVKHSELPQRDNVQSSPLYIIFHHKAFLHIFYLLLPLAVASHLKCYIIYQKIGYGRCDRVSHHS